MGKITALYLRLSVDDENLGESGSISHQRDLLSRFVHDDPTFSNKEIVEFVDDGWSGTNMERPGIRSLLERTRRGEVTCIIVKDMSRFGRNYVEVSEYIEQIFPFLGVRFISVNDHYDSDDHKGKTAPLDVAFGTIMHDIYCKELSQKVKQSYVAKAKKGEFLCGVAPFGFIKSEVEKNKLVIDEDAATVVRRIFSLACEGNTTSEIAVILNDEQIPTPLEYRKQKGRILRGDKSAIIGRWYDKNVRKIIYDERYIGMQVSGKTKKTKIGSRNVIVKPEAEWIRVLGAHDAIVTEEVFQMAQGVIKRYKKTGESQSHALFAGMMKCGHCGRALRYQSTGNSYYYCNGNKLGFERGCFNEKVYVEDIKTLVLQSVKTEGQKVLELRKKRRKVARDNATGMDAAGQEIKRLVARTSRLVARTSRLERQSVALYEDYADGRLDKADYVAAKTVLATEQSDTESRIAKLNELIVFSKLDYKISDDESILKRILNTCDVTDEVLALIERIMVYDQERIEIRFTFDDTNM